MKISIVIICLTVVVYSCGNGSNSAESTKAAPAATDAPASGNANASGSADNEKGLDLIVKSDCTTCHKIEEKLIGPAYRDVANKYTDDEQTVSMLANKVISGGKGVWGPIAMTPHPQLSVDDAKEMVRYVLSLKNK